MLNMTSFTSVLTLYGVYCMVCDCGWSCVLL